MKDKNFGFLLIDKPVGWTSFDVCAKLRKQLNTKKIGHTGTLDPFATGILVVAVGKATKLIPFFEKDRKTYETEILLGHMSETLDTESEIRKVSSEECVVDRVKVELILESVFSGKIEQVPPKYSALKIGGKKMCDMARKGEEFEIKPRETEVIKVEVLSLDFPVVKVRLTVAAGFYVRSFARDLGEALGLGGGICQQLRRVGVGDITINNEALVMRDKSNVSKLKNNFLSFPCRRESRQLDLPIISVIESVTPENLISPEKILKLPQVEIAEDRIPDFLQGRVFPFESKFEDKFMVLSGGRFLGVGEMKCGNLQPRLGFS